MSFLLFLMMVLSLMVCWFFLDGLLEVLNRLLKIVCGFLEVIVSFCGACIFFRSCFMLFVGSSLLCSCVSGFRTVSGVLRHAPGGSEQFLPVEVRRNRECWVL